MYEELVKRLKETTVNHDDKCESCPYEEDYPCCVDCIDEMHIEAANAIEELEKFYQIMADAYETEVTKERWIPVTERLPKEENRSYWICTDTGYQCECRWTNNYFGIGESGEWGWCIVDVPQYHKVVAWMDLPEPYKPPKEET